MTTSSTRPVALVTGARQGLGRSAALHLAAAGFDLVVLDVADEAEVTLAELRAAGAQASYLQGDIADTVASEQLAEVAWAAFGRIDCLVNNAGVAQRPLTDLLDITPEQYDRVMDINLRGTFFLTQAVAKRMIANPSQVARSVIMIGSIAARMVNLDRSPYHLSKAGISMLTELFALRLAEAGIAVYEIRPGYMLTEMTQSAVPEVLDAAISAGRVPERRWGQPDDIGRAVATLAGGGLSYATGQAIWIDGGLHIHRAD
ncbi:MAG: 3-ketoacyl-ACP reductase [Microbacteriaceae bacterium]